jgi:hypothetical protein
VLNLVHSFPWQMSGCQYKQRSVSREINIPVAEMRDQVRTLLYDYLTDEEQGAVSGRNPISSINEILREGKFSRDRAKVFTRSILPSIPY